MRKFTATTILVIFAAGTVMFLFSACSMFRDFSRGNTVLTEQEKQKFIGSIRARSSSADSHYELGCYMQSRKKHKPAIEEFKTVLEIDPGHVKAHNAMGVSYDALGDHGRAVESYRTALNIDPKLDYVLNNLGYSYLLQGRADLAVEHFKMALELDGKNARYRNNLGLAYAKSGQHDAALAELKESGDEARAHYNIAQLYYRDGLYKEAKTHFEEASHLKASDPESEKGLKAAGRLSEILAKSEKDPEITVQTTIAAKEAGQPEPEKSGISTIPAEALSRIKGAEVVKPRLVEAPAYRVALPRIDHGQDKLETTRRTLKTNMFVILSEAQTIELLSLQEAGDRPAKRIKIEVANGNGVRRMARNVGKYLRGKDVILMYLSNASHYKHEETRIYYAPGYLMEAYCIAQRLPGRQSLKEVTAVRNGNAQVSVLIGRDIVPHLNKFRGQKANKVAGKLGSWEAGKRRA